MTTGSHQGSGRRPAEMLEFVKDDQLDLAFPHQPVQSVRL
jgi:hypothetical protein